jgi:hypothetical protein
MLKWDAKLSRALHISDNHRKVLALVLKFFAHSGDSWFWLAGLLITWLLTEGEWRERLLFLLLVW